MKIPDNLAPWCEGCPLMDLELVNNCAYARNVPVYIDYSIRCRHIETCKKAVEQARTLEEALRRLADSPKKEGSA